jgi:hypothetical protein
MRRLALILITTLVWLSSGCTSSDRDYVRNNIALLEKHKQTAPHPELLRAGNP